MDEEEWISIQNHYRKLIDEGPDRVLIQNEISVPWRIAVLEHKIIPTIVFIRNDGWMLGAKGSLISIAWEICKNDWIGFIRRPMNIIFPISEWFGE